MGRKYITCTYFLNVLITEVAVSKSGRDHLAQSLKSRYHNHEYTAITLIAYSITNTHTHTHTHTDVALNML